MPWDIENYYIVDGRVLSVEIAIPLMEFLYTSIDDVREAWLDMLKEFVSEEPGVEMSWEMQPRDKDALVTIRIAKQGNLEVFTAKEAKGALGAVDALFDRENPKKEAAKGKPKSSPKAAKVQPKKSKTQKRKD
ncbi:MAG: hypothetical protein ACFFEF_15055 [Candidatus Thorarchaeota archaeon]